MADVILVRWPEERDDAARLVEAGVALLYLVDADADPPEPTSCLEDWVRLPGDNRDLRARLVALEGRATRHRVPPTVDGSGRLHYHGQLLPLSAEEASLARALAARFREVVSDADLAVALGDQAGLRHHMSHLRSRLRPVDLTVWRAPRRGYVLQDH
jgi:two-component system, OmpR family, response regulator